MTIEKLFAGVLLLRQRTLKHGVLEVVHPRGHVWIAGFEWFPPKPIEVIQQIERQVGHRLPEDYVAFLVHVSDGAMLYLDLEYGQWGFKIYGTGELLEEQDKWLNVYGREWMSNVIPIAKNRGEEYVLAIDLSRPSFDNQSCAVVEVSPYEPPEDWSVASRSFHEWLDHLIVAQGTKYWQWV